MDQSITLTEKECPECQSIIEVHPDYVAWCQECNWNVQPSVPDPPTNLFQKFYASFGEQQSVSLYKSITSRKSLRPTLTLSTASAYLIALVTHLLTVGLLVLGVWLLVFGIPGFARLLSIFIGLMCLGAVWGLRPRFGKIPDRYVLNQQEAPHLHEFVGRIADALGAKPVDYIQLSPFYTASYGRAGWLQKKVLTIGLPLFKILSPQEKTALIGHELAHEVNGDATRGPFVGLAIDSLIGWYALLRPKYIWDPNSGFIGLFMIPFNLVYLLLSTFGWIGAYILIHLLWRDTQRAEYFADYLSSTVSGSGAMLGLLEKLEMYQSFTIVLQKVALTPELRDKDLFAMIRERINSVPKLELERVKRVQQMEMSRLDITHPPTTYRIEAIKAHPNEEMKVRLTESEAAKIDKEMEAIAVEIQKKLIDMRREGYFSL